MSQLSAIEYLIETAQRVPDKIALSDKNSSLTFAELMKLAHFNSKFLKNCQGKPVLVYSEKSCEAIVAFAAVLLAGGFYVPIDIEAPLERQIKILHKIQPKYILYASDQIGSLSELCYEAGVSHKIEMQADQGHVDNNWLIEYGQNTIDTNPCYVIFTSGSTGDPKGVVISHRSVIDYIDWAIEALNPSEKYKIGNQAPLFFDNSTLDIYLSWALGAELHLISPQEFVAPASLIQYINSHQIDWMFVVPSVLGSVQRINAFENLSCNLSTVLIAGEALKTSVIRYWQEHLPDCRFINLYGPTEITVDCTWFPIPLNIELPAIVPIGYPCRNTDFIILRDDGEVCQDSETGELCIRGSSLALGYYNDPEKTAQCFVQNPLHNNYLDLIYKTGDFVQQVDGILHFIGRKDNQIKLNGYRIELGDIETALRSHQSIHDCICLFNNKRNSIVAAYESDNELDNSLLSYFLKSKLPKYMCPKNYVWYKKFPMTQNHKIDRVTLQLELFPEI